MPIGEVQVPRGGNRGPIKGRGGGVSRETCTDKLGILGNLQGGAWNLNRGAGLSHSGVGAGQQKGPRTQSGF